MVNYSISVVPAVGELWNTWEIHCLILVSLFLRVFLFLFAGMRRRSSSRVLTTVLWLAYLSADSVAIFVLGHLAVRTSELGHQLMSFWAPFVLVHLGGQDTITALSRQDNELWRRHMLNLVTQVAVAGYVVAKASWPDARLRAAMVIMFLSGSIKYAERTWCLYKASPARLSLQALDFLSYDLKQLQQFCQEDRDGSVHYHKSYTFDGILGGGDQDKDGNPHILSVEAPLNTLESNVSVDDLPDLLEKKLLPNPCRFRAYDFVGEALKSLYQELYTKRPIRQLFYSLSFSVCE